MDVLAIMVEILAEPASIRPVTLAETVFNKVFADKVSVTTVVTADSVPTLPVFACIKPTMFAVDALIALMMFAEPPDNMVLAVIVPLIMYVLATNPAVTTPVLATKAAVVIPVLATMLPTCRRVVNDSVVVMYELELRDITYALLDVYNVAVFTKVFAEIDLALTAPATFAQPALISKFAVKFCV